MVLRIAAVAYGCLMINLNATAQEREVSELIQNLRDSSVATRTQAVDDLAAKGTPAVDRLFNTMLDADEERSTRRLCAKVLLAMHSSQDKKLRATLVEYLRKHEIQKFPHATSELKALRSRILGDIYVKQRVAIQKLTKLGCSISSGRQNLLVINTENFRGTIQQFKYIVAIKSPIALKICLGKRHELFQFLPQLNLTSIELMEHESFAGENLSADLQKKLCKAMESLCRSQSLKQLIARSTSVDDQMLQWIGNLKNLESVVFGTGVTDVTLARVGKLKKLRSIDFHNCNRINGSGFSAFDENKLVTVLSLYYCGMKTENLKYLSKFPNLNRLTLHQKCTNSDVREICHLPKISMLTIDNTYVNDKVFESLTKMKQLRSLAISESAITDRSVPKINAMKKLEHFSIGYTFLSQKGFDAIHATKHLISQDFDFYQPLTPKSIDVIHELVDRDIGIGVGLKSEITLSLYGEHNCDLANVDLGQLDIETVYVRQKLNPKSLDVIMKLDRETIILIASAEITEKTISRLRKRFYRVSIIRKASK